MWGVWKPDLPVYWRVPRTPDCVSAQEIRKLRRLLRVRGTGMLRSLPWRNENVSPFRYLITEILLQQTRADMVARLWPTSLSTFPTGRQLTPLALKRLQTCSDPLGCTASERSN